MDALRKTLVLSIVIAVALCAVPALSDETDGAGDMDGLMLYEVASGTPRGVSLHNYGQTTVDLRDYIVSDKPDITRGSEGWLSFSQSITIGPGETITLADDVSQDYVFTNRGTALSYEEGNPNGIVMNGSFNPANGGDDVYLMDSDGNIIDAFFYGDRTSSDPSVWTGDTVSLSRDQFVQRYGITDTDSASDWGLPGSLMLDFDPELKYDATVTPFLFPDSGGIPLYQAIESATETIDIEIYMITSTNLYALLCQKEAQGVDVRLLLEGSNLNNNLDAYTPYIQALVDSGGEVRMIDVAGEGAFDRYTFVHAKYAIIDGDTVLVTSENWTVQNLNGSLDDDPYDSSRGDGNRGWGAVIESSGYAAYMDMVFENDWTTEYGDVKPFTELYDVNAASVTYTAPDSVPDGYFESYNAKVTPILSNDNSYDALTYYISQADERFYSQQQSLSSSYANLNDGYPLGMVADRAAAGVDCKLLFSDEVDSGIIDVVNGTTHVEAAIMTSPYVHNKGVVSDDVVWVSSVNWTPTSFFENREVAVAIESPEIADFFADAFLRDHDRYYVYDGLKVDVSEIEDTYVGGQEITLSVIVANGSGDYSYTWDLGDGSEPRTTDESRIVCIPAWDGVDVDYTLTVTVHDNVNDVTGTATATYRLTAQADGSSDGLSSFVEDNGYILIPIIVIILAIAAAVMRSRGGKKSTKTKKER